ncbi:hypothetical protein EON81_20355 [bacterium]|nr:MAG: hypothetical protein EON81_20355 [bacterium]
MQTVEYRPALWKTLAYLLFFAVAAGGCAWMAARPNVGLLERGVGIVGSILFGAMALVVLVASDIPSNLGKGPRAPVGLTGPDGESLGYGYIVNPSIVDVRPPDLIGQVQQRLQDRLADWDPQDKDGEPSHL